MVPRMAAGEVTPDGLIAIGQIAKRYQLYSKVTGGQRIDLFGARLEQLPAIWRELADAGFETGHAYGKSLRTVKSCVGSTRVATACKTPPGSRYGSSIAIKGYAPRTKSRWRSPAAPANALKPVERYRGDCHRQRLESVRLRQRRDETASRRPVCQRSRRSDADPQHRSSADVLYPYRRSPAANQHRMDNRRAASPICGRWCWRIVLALARSWSRRWPGSSTATSASGRPPSTIRSVWRCSAPSLIATSPTRLCSAAICAVSRSRC